MAVDSNDTMYILNLQKIWKSDDAGISWTNIKSDFNGAGDSSNGKSIALGLNDYVYIVDASEDTYVSTDGGANFTLYSSNFNNGNGNVAGLSSLLRRTNITIQVRNCSSSCTNEEYVGLDRSSNSVF